MKKLLALVLAALMLLASCGPTSVDTTVTDAPVVTDAPGVDTEPGEPDSTGNDPAVTDPADTVTVPPEGVNLKALENMLFLLAQALDYQLTK